MDEYLKGIMERDGPLAQTNTVTKAQAPMSVAEMSAAIEKHGMRTPVGFIVSQAIYDGLRTRYGVKTDLSWHFGGCMIVVDPKLEPSEMEIAHTAEAWHKRLLEIHKAAL